MADNTSVMDSHSIKIIQHNTNRSSPNMDVCLETAVQNQIDCVFLQEPCMVEHDNVFNTNSHPAYYCMLPSGNCTRHRVAVFARKASRFVLTQRTDLAADSDMIIVDVSGPDIETFQIVNIYNEKCLGGSSSSYTVERSLQHLSMEKEALVLGDFNSHHSWWNSAISNSTRADELVQWLDNNSFELVNEPVIPTFSRPGCADSVLDLSFATQRLYSQISDW